MSKYIDKNHQLRVDLSLQMLDSIPSSIASDFNLVEIVLTSNQFTCIPIELCALPALR
jgi:hypothetical protein